jgi:hypothetical protein
MKKIYPLILFAFLSPVIHLQGQICLFNLPPDSTVYTNYPWYGNNEYLDSIADVLGYNDPLPQYSTMQSNIEGGPSNAWLRVRFPTG